MQIYKILHNLIKSRQIKDGKIKSFHHPIYLHLTSRDSLEYKGKAEMLLKAIITDLRLHDYKHTTHNPYDLLIFTPNKYDLGDRKYYSYLKDLRDSFVVTKANKKQYIINPEYIPYIRQSMINRLVENLKPVIVPSYKITVNK